MATAVVFHKGGLAHYLLSKDEMENFTADLKRYDGRPGNEPPIQLVLLKNGISIDDNNEHRHLLNDLFRAFQTKFR